MKKINSITTIIGEWLSSIIAKEKEREVINTAVLLSAQLIKNFDKKDLSLIGITILQEIELYIANEQKLQEQELKEYIETANDVIENYSNQLKAIDEYKSKKQ